MKNLVFIMLFLLMSGLCWGKTQENSLFTPQLQEKLDSASDHEFIRINIRLKNQFDSDELMRQTQFLTKEEKRDVVVNELRNFSRTSQSAILNQMNEMNRSLSIKNIRSLWITNVINCYAQKEAILELTERDDIAQIDYDEYRQVLNMEESKENKTVPGNPNSREITWNVSKVDADDVWGLGYTGDGVVVAVLDTGVRYTHNDLDDHLWTDPSYPNHGYDFYNDDNNPMDDHGHGTHCAGTIAGDGTSGSQTGVAPDAQIMACKVLNSAGGGHEYDVWDAIEFAVENGADIMSMSIGWQHRWGPDRTSWRNAMNNALAAGVIASVAASNEGDNQSTYPIPDNVGTPGDVPPPWLNPDQTLTGGKSAVVCVGATDNTDTIAYFSSLGPVTWEDIFGFNDYAYSPEMGLIRPDISAPGVDIKSLDYSSDTGYASGWNGTSMATPCVAGTMALMLEKNNSLAPADICRIIEENCDIPQSPKNNTYGSGRINAYDAVVAVSNTTANPGISTQSSFSQTLKTDQSDSQTLSITNNGDSNSILNYTVTYDYTSRSDDSGRSISGSTFESYFDHYIPGTTFDIGFVIRNTSTDDEWLDGASLDFPSGVTVNSSTDFVGGYYGPLVTNGNTGNGATITWSDNNGGYGNIRPDESAQATVNVTVSSSFSGNMTLDWTLSGDVYGSTPHDISGSITLSHKWLQVGSTYGIPVVGDCDYDETDNITLTFNSQNLSVGTYTADITIQNSAGADIVIPVTLDIAEDPNPATLVQPADGGPGTVHLEQLLEWSPGTGLPPDGYKLYLNNFTPPTSLEYNGTSTSFLPDTLLLDFDTTYYWQVVPYTTGRGDASGCPIWTFTTNVGDTGSNTDDNSGNPDADVNVDIPPVEADGNEVDPDVVVNPDASTEIEVTITVDDQNQQHSVPNPDNVSLSYYVAITGDLGSLPVEYTLSFAGLGYTPNEVIFWNGSAWEEVTSPNWSTPNEVTFSITMPTSRANTTEILLNKGGDSPLPIELSAFFAVFNNGTPILNWTTQSESNNIGWNVYRSLNESFDEALQVNEHMIPGAGTTTEPTEYTFDDLSNIDYDTIYWYWLESLDNSCLSDYHGPISLIIPQFGNDNPNPPQQFLEYGLFQNYPNPFYPNTEVSFRMKENTFAEVTVYNLKGEKVKKVFSDNVPQNALNRTAWDGKDEKGKPVSSGIYIYELKAGEHIETKRMILMK